jgi:hypothetical protein
METRPSTGWTSNVPRNGSSVRNERAMLSRSVVLPVLRCAGMSVEASHGISPETRACGGLEPDHPNRSRTLGISRWRRPILNSAWPMLVR